MENPQYDPKLNTKELADTISSLVIKKANTKFWQLLVLGVLAGVYISFGGHLFLAAMEQGMGRVVGGMVFSLGLVLVVVAGAELFTGNILMIIGTILSLYSVLKILKNWLAVYIGNLIGSLLFVILIVYSGLLYTNGQLNNLGTLASRVADAKLAMSCGEAFARGILCNMLVILAIIMSVMSKDIVSKVVCIIFPIMAFVASGYEHCIANMYLIPIGLCAKGVPCTGLHIMFQNIVPVTLGNIVGGLAVLLVHPNRIRQLMHLFTLKKNGLLNK
jgi:formate/nitrite transporter